MRGDNCLFPISYFQIGNCKQAIGEEGGSVYWVGVDFLVVGYV